MDAAPPLQVSASVQGMSLVLVYDEALDPASMPATGAYTVTATVCGSDAAFGVNPANHKAASAALSRASRTTTVRLRAGHSMSSSGMSLK